MLVGDDLDRLGPDGGCQVRLDDRDRSLHPGKRPAAVGGGGVAGRQSSAQGADLEARAGLDAVAEAHQLAGFYDRAPASAAAWAECGVVRSVQGSWGGLVAEVEVAERDDELAGADLHEDHQQ